MKVLYVNNFFTKYGGAEIALNRISKLMLDKANQVYFFSTNKKPYYIENYEYSKYFPEFSDKRELSLKNINKILKIFYNFEAKNKLQQYIKEIKPDIIDFHNIHYHLTSSVLDICKENNTKTCLYIHDPRYFCPGGMLLYGETYCEKEYCIKGNPLHCVLKKCKNGNLKASILSAITSLFTRSRNVFNKVDFIICPSIAMKDLAIRAGVPKEKIKVINHFIEKEKFEIEPQYSNKNYFLYVGRLDKEKGIHYLIEAMSFLPKDIELHIVGKGYDEDDLKKLAAENNLSNIKFLGFKSGADLEDEYKNCSATILPCNWFEAFGLTIIESFLYGKPVIASKIGAIPEIIDNGKNGILVEPKNVDMLKNAILDLHNNPQKVIEMGKNGRRKLEEFYNSELYYEKYSELFKLN